MTSPEVDFPASAMSVFTGSSPPSTLSTKLFWLDTSGSPSPPVLRWHNSTSWMSVTGDPVTGSNTIRTAEINVGAGRKNKDVIVLTVIDADILPSSVIMVNQSGAAATGKTADENELDHFTCNARPATAGGAMIVTIKPADKITLQGKYRINYAIGQ